MSKKQKIKHMSSEELKSKLYAHFQKSGTFDQLRAQLRGQLVSELFKVSEPTDQDKFPDVSDVEKCLLPLQVCNWLVHDHLTRQDYQYSLSTFVTEAQLPYPEKILTAGDVLRLLGLSQNAEDFESISQLYSKNNELGYLHSLLLAIIKALFSVPNRDLSLNQSHCQSGEANSSIKKIDSGKEELPHSFMRKKSEAIVDESFSGEFSKFKQIGINKSFLSDDNVKSTDVSFHEQLQSIREEKEKEIQKLRHKLLEEIEKFHSEEHKMKLETEYIKSELRLKQNKLLKEMEMLKEKEMLLEKEIANKFEMKMRDVESDFASKLHYKDKEIESVKQKLLEKDEKLAHVEIELRSEKDSYGLMKQELDDLKHMYKIIHDKYSSVLDENTNLLKKFENMSDYTVLKEELTAKSKEVTRLHTEIRDMHQKSEAERKKFVETVRNLEDNLNMKESQLLQLRDELDQLKSTLKKEQGVWNRERKLLEHQLIELKELHTTGIQKIEDQKEEIEDLHQTIHVLNYKLTNNVINTVKSKTSGCYKNFQRASTFQKSKPETLFTKRNTLLQQQPENHDSSSLKFLSDAKGKFSELNQENDAVQEKYSVIYSAIPEYNKQSDSYFENYNVTPLKKNDNGNYDTFSKPISITSYSYGNWSENKLPTYTKNTYSLSDVKRMVTHSLSPHKSSHLTDFQESLSKLRSSQMTNINTVLKDTWKITGSHTHNSSNKQYGITEPSDDISILNTVKHKNLSDKKNSTVSDDSAKLILQDDDVDKTASSPKEQSGSENIIVSDSNKLQQQSENISSSQRNSLIENSNKTLFGVNEKAIQPSSETLEAPPGLQNVSNENDAVNSQAKPLLVLSSQELPGVASRKIGNKPESSSSVFVNLDAAWKKRSSITSLSFGESGLIEEANLKEKLDDSLVPSATASANRTMLSTIQDTLNKNLGQPSLSERECEIIGENNLKEKLDGLYASSSTTPVNKMQDTQNRNLEQLEKKHETHVPGKSFADVDNKTIEENTSVVLQTEGKAPELTLENEPSFNVENKNSTDDRETTEVAIPKHTEEQDKAKSAEKIESADSISELSEIHLSCGSEAEQKEDSEDW